jgi:DUF1680 family protein
MKDMLKPVGLESVTVNGGFWGERQQQLRETVIYDQYEKIDRRGEFRAFRLQWQSGVDPKPHFFWDSDVYKWLEAASYCLTIGNDAKLEEMVTNVIDLIASAQQPDGYINLYYMLIEPDKKWTDLMDTHELYCAGHLIEAAVAHYNATGKRKLLETACKFADLMDKKLGPEPGKLRGYDGHQEVELALVKLYQVTGNDHYLQLSRFFIMERGQRPLYYALEYENRGKPPFFVDYRLQNKIEDWREYYQVHKPVLEQDEVVGHAVRVMYFGSGIADIARETGDKELWETGKRLWRNLTAKRMYLTGGAGNSHHNEGFTKDYELPNDTGYCETCAAIGLVFWNHRMLQAECDGKYGDLLERALYNGALSGISLDGTRYFYMNPLSSDGSYHRAPFQGCACCPPNLARLIGSFGQYIYGSGESELAIHLYASSEASLEIGGKPLTVSQETGYPWNGKTTICFGCDSEVSFTLKLRIPSWLDRPIVTVNGLPVDLEANLTNGYLTLQRVWQDEDRVEVSAEMDVKRVYANPHIIGNLGRVALQRGPIVYCFESVDQPTAELECLSLPDREEIEALFDPQLLRGVVKLSGRVLVTDEEWGDDLYRTQPPTKRICNFTAVPYYAWDNRDEGKMVVWIRENEMVSEIP